jgi:large subunit ribosomal protein L1
MATKKLTKRQQKMNELLASVTQPTSMTEGVATLQNVLSEVSKFNESIECHLRLGINMKHADQQVRTTVVLPKGTGKTVRVAVIAKGEKVNEAKEAGADFYGSDELLEKIQKENFFDFDVLIATPDMMAQVGKIGRVLGPKGLMPNPKSGTVTPNVAEAVKNMKSGQVEIRPDKQGIVHVGVGKREFSQEDLLTNIFALFDAVQRAKPSAAKGTYVKSVYITSTHGPSIKIDPAALVAEAKGNVA